MQRSLGLMALDVSSKRPSIMSSPEPSPPPSGPCSPRDAMLGLATFPLYNPVLQLKAVAEGTSRYLALQHAARHAVASHLVPSPSPPRLFPNSPSPSSQAQSPQPSLSSPLALTSPSNNTSERHPMFMATGTHNNHHHRLNHNNLASHHKSLKFSIDNILSPAFGKNGELLDQTDAKRPPKTQSSSSPKSFDISSLTGFADSKLSNNKRNNNSHKSSGTKQSSANGHTTKKQAQSQSISSTVKDESTRTNNNDRPQPVGKRKHSSDSESSTTSSTFSSSTATGSEKKGKTSKSSSNILSSPLRSPNDLINSSVDGKDIVWPAWVYCTRYSDRPSSGKSGKPFFLFCALQHKQS